MDTLYDFFFGFEPSFRWISLLTKALLFMLLGTGMCYVLWFVASKFLYRKSSFMREHIVQLAMVWAIVFYIIVFSFYCFFFFKFVGFENIAWENWKTYIALLPQLLTFVVCLVVGTFLVSKYKKDLNPLNL